MQDFFSQYAAIQKIFDTRGTPHDLSSSGILLQPRSFIFFLSRIMTQYMRGVIMVLASALFLSTSGVGLRVIESAGAWQILFYRSISMATLVFILLVLFNRGAWVSRFKTITKDDVLLAVVLGSGFVAYVFALLMTTVANALFIFSAAPFLAAVLGWFLLGELKQNLNDIQQTRFRMKS